MDMSFYCLEILDNTLNPYYVGLPGIIWMYGVQSVSDLDLRIVEYVKY